MRIVGCAAVCLGLLACGVARSSTPGGSTLDGATATYIEQLRSAAQNVEPAGRCEIATLLGDSGDDGALPVLAELETSADGDRQLISRINVARSKMARPEDRGSAADVEYLTRLLEAETASAATGVRYWAQRGLADLGKRESWSAMEASMAAVRGEHRLEQLEHLRARHQLSMQGNEGLAIGLRHPTQTIAMWALDKIEAADPAKAMPILRAFTEDIEKQYTALPDDGSKAAFSGRCALAYSRSLDLLPRLGGMDRSDAPSVIREMILDHRWEKLPSVPGVPLPPK